ncbi:hypothetical protein MMC16_001914 [Acarospora aff. strigata]|nr:hypothetical protein [Acarospora aff. strigata]
MKLSLTALVVGIFTTGALSAKKPCINCRDPYFAGFQDIPGIASLCNNAVRPTTTVTQPITAYVTSTSTITVSNWRYTDYHYTTPTPTSTRCPTANAFAAKLADSESSAGLIRTRHAPSPTPAALVRRADSNEKCKDCLPVAEGITSACSCFFTAGPQQTVTQNQTVATSTYTTTTTSTTYIYSVRTRTIAGALSNGSRPDLVPIHASPNMLLSYYCLACRSSPLPMPTFLTTPPLHGIQPFFSPPIYLPTHKTPTNPSRLFPKTEGCYATNVPVYGAASYAICGSPGIPSEQMETCRASSNSTASTPFSFDAQECCSACANTLDCFQAYTDPASNTCTLDIRIGSDGSNTNRTADCPNYHTYVQFGEYRGYEYGGTYYSGFIGGHCSQGC